jgi:RNA polymerase sigma-70 factor (ECF subfamily)
MELNATTATPDTGSNRARGPADGELERLIADCARRDARALRALYDLTSSQLLACMIRILKRRALAEEALQDVFVSVWQRAAQYESRRGRPWTWLVSIARHRAIDVVRSERAELFREAVIEELPQLVSVDESTANGTSEKTAAAVARCLGRLTTEQRRGIELAFIDGYSHAEISKVTGQPLGTIKSWIRRGLLSLRDCLQR